MLTRLHQGRCRREEVPIPSRQWLIAHPYKGVVCVTPTLYGVRQPKAPAAISDVDRAAWEHFVERPQFGAGRDALDTKVVAVGAGPAGWPVAAIFAFFWRLGKLAGPLIV